MKTIVIASVFLALTLQVSHSQGPSQLPPASEMKTLGLIGGTSWYSTVDYYRYINEAVNDAYGNSTNPPLILYNMDQEKIHELQARGQWNEIAALITETASRLRAGGAQVIRVYWFAVRIAIRENIEALTLDIEGMAG
jgi:aspartate racemase